MRRDKIIGSSLDAEVDIYCSDKIHTALLELESELRFVFITSEALIHRLGDKPKDAVDVDENLALRVRKSSYQKCVRCWHFIADVGSNLDYPEICGRCIDNISGQGEVRAHA